MPAFNLLRNVFPWAPMTNVWMNSATVVTLKLADSIHLGIGINTLTAFLEQANSDKDFTFREKFNQEDETDTIGAVSAFVGRLKEAPKFKEPFFRMFPDPEKTGGRQGWLATRTLEAECSLKGKSPLETFSQKIPDGIQQGPWLTGFSEGFASREIPINLSINDFMESNT